MATTTVEKRFCDVTGAQKGVTATCVTVSVDGGNGEKALLYNTTLDLGPKVRERLLAAISRALKPNKRAEALAQQTASTEVANPSGQDDGAV